MRKVVKMRKRKSKNHLPRKTARFIMAMSQQEANELESMSHAVGVPKAEYVREALRHYKNAALERIYGAGVGSVHDELEKPDEWVHDHNDRLQSYGIRGTAIGMPFERGVDHL